MKKGKIRNRVLAWILTMAMVLSMTPVTALAEEITQPAGCTHIHDENCGYVEAVAEVPCDKECTDTDGDGVIDHVEDCAYTPAVEGQPCNHVHDENCGGLTENQSEETQPKQTQPEETEQELSNELLTLKARIDALPTGEEYRAMTSDEQDAVYEEAADIVDACLTLTEEELAAIGHDRLEALFMVMNEEVQLYDNTEPVTFKNSGYPYGKDMDYQRITLVIEINGTAASYQWQSANSESGPFKNITGATQSTYRFKPVSGQWYRCMVNSTASKAVMAVHPQRDNRKWTHFNGRWHLSNGTMAYVANGKEFNAVGLYTKENTDYMLSTSYDTYWEMFSSNSSTPSPGGHYSGYASLDALRVSFSESDDYALIFEADLAEGQKAFSFGCNTQLGDEDTSSYYTFAPVMATVKNGKLQQVAIIGAETVSSAKETDPAFVISPVDSASKFWIGPHQSRRTYAYNTEDGNAYVTIDNERVVTLLEGTDSGMTMSWMNIPSGGSVKFQFSVGNVKHTGAVSGNVDCKVDYEKDALTGLDAGTTYILTYGESTYTIKANESGEIPLSGTDNDENAYDFAGKSLNIAKQGSEDTTVEVEVAGRPVTPTVDESIEIVELTPNSATISPKEGQQYAYSTDRTNWKILTNTESNGNYVINGLTEGATIYIRTRIPATSSTLASQWSEPTQIKLKRTIVASANSWSGSYDGNAHQITVNVTSPVENAIIKYSSTANGNYDEENPSFKDVGTYTVYYCVMAEGYYPTYGSATVTISQREVELEWSNTSLIYNGMEQKPTVNVKADSLCGNDTCTVILGDGKTDSNAKAGEVSYSITVTGLTNSNYKLPSASEQLTNTYTIAQKEVGIDWSNNTFTYDRALHKPTATLTGVEENDTCNVTVTGEQTNAGTNYTATASIDNANYKIKTSDLTTTFVINPKEITEDMISLNDTDSIYDFTNSEITPVVTVKDGEVVLTGGETGDYVLAGDLTGTAYGSYEITVSGKGNYTGTPKVVWNITDPNAPTGEIILKENKWNSFLNTITFGLFFKNTQQITVNATDGENESGVDKVYYCVSDTLLTDSASLDSATWTGISNGGSFNINPNAKVCVYVKITDKAGNAAYISSNGIVVYTDSARDTDKITFTKTSAEDVTATVTLNGNTISKVTNGTTELTKGSHYTISADGATITFKASYLQTLSAGDYTINVSYNPMGETYVDAEGNDQPVDTSITLSVKRASSDNADTKITNKDNLSKEYNGQPTEAATPSSKNGSTPKVEYKKKGNPDSSFTEEVPKDAGDYVVRVTYPQDENYEKTSATEEFTISPKAVTAVVSVSTKIYNGTTDAEVTATVDTGITGQTLTITGLTGTFDNKNAGTGKRVTIDSTNAQITAGEDTNAANYKITYPATGTGNITAKTLNAVMSAANKVYDGTTTAEVTATVETGIGEETLTITGLTGSFADQNVGTDKNVSIDSTGASVQAGAGTSADNYTVVYPAASTASITARPVTLTWSSADLTYTGSEQEVTAEVSNKASGADSFTITYTNNKKTAVGKYTATVTDLGNSNYTLTGAEGITKKWSISYLVTDAKAAPSGDTRNDSGWFIGTVTLTPDSGYRISKDGTTWSDTLTVIDDGESTVTYYLKDRNGSITDQKTVTIKKDSTTPGGEIKAGENSFTKFLNTITFGYFFKNTVDVEISGTDATSGIAKIEYQKVAKGETYNADGTWTAGTSFSMTANDKSVIYARITDVAGNTVIINSEGIVVYKDATGSDVLDYTRTTNTNVVSNINLNGNTVKEMKNGDALLREGTDYTVEGGKIVLKAAYLESLQVADYTLTVSYNPYGENFDENAHGAAATDSTIHLTVKRAGSEDADTKITNKDNLSKEYNGQPTEAATPSSKNGSTPKVEYKKKGDPDSSFIEEVPKDAGDYVVRVTYPQDENYEETSVTEEFTISPKAVTAVVSVSTKTYNGTTDAEVTATVDTGITGQKLAITGLTGTFDNKNAGTGKTVTINSTNAQVTAGAGTNAANYSITYPAESTGSIQAASLTIKVNDASKHIGKADPAFSYSVITGILVEGDSISGITFTRTAGETAGTYDITATETVGSNPNYNITITDGTMTIEDHTLVTDAAIVATCTKSGISEGSHCSVCNEVIVAQKEVPALGHDWSGEWTIVKEATATTDGKRETICTRDGCGQKKYETIPATGTPEEPENPNAGKLDKDAEVEPDAPIDEATLDNKKSELLDAPAIFTETEKQQIQSGTDARVWLDVKRTDESSIPAEDKKEVTKEAEKIMGENPMITYFDVDLFKQVEGGDKTQIHEPGIDIQVTILIPDELLNHDRTMVREYKIIRLHYDAVTGESKVDVLSGDFDRGTGEFSFKTDKFSTFAIAYTDIQLVTGITLTADSATLTGSGETVQLTATVAPDNAVNKNVIWTSSDPNVATVDANGKVAAVGNGTCTITATTEDGSYTAICTIKVEIPDSDNGGNNGDNNSGDNNQSNEDANTPANTKEDKKPNVEAPKTGDAGNVTLWSLLLALSALALAGIRVARRKRSSSIEK